MFTWETHGQWCDETVVCTWPEVLKEQVMWMPNFLPVGTARLGTPFLEDSPQ